MTAGEQRAADAAAVQAAQDARCADCGAARQARILESEIELRRAAEATAAQAVDASLRWQGERDAMREERDAALTERDARVADAALRAQRVDVEALRFKVAEMKKMLAAVDARADERFAAQLRAKDAAWEARLEAVQAEAAGVAAQLAAGRAGAAARIQAVREALEVMWAWDRRDRGGPRSEREAWERMRQLLSVAFVQPQ